MLSRIEAIGPHRVSTSEVLLDGGKVNDEMLRKRIRCTVDTVSGMFCVCDGMLYATWIR